MALNARQERFAAEYLVDLNATQAAIRAGYSAKTACEQGYALLRNPQVAAAIAAGRQRQAVRVEITQDEVLSILRTNAARAAQAEPVRDREGNPTGEYTYQGSVVNRAAELLGKHLGMFTERVDVTSGGQKIPFAAFAAIMGYTPGAEPESDAT